MARFQINVRSGYTGVGAGGVNFTAGEAVITSDTREGLAALAYFVSNPGYDVLPLDEVQASDVLRQGNESPAEESKRLQAEIDELRARRDIERLRRERDDLYRDVYGRDRADERQAQLTPGSEGEDEPPQNEQGPEVVVTDASSGKLLPPPAESAPVGEWRKWAVDSGRAKTEDVEKASRSQIISEHGAAYDRDREAELKGGSAGAEGSEQK